MEMELKKNLSQQLCAQWIMGQLSAKWISFKLVQKFMTMD